MQSIILNIRLLELDFVLGESMMSIIREKIDEILVFARKNANSIRYNTVIDILREKNDTLSEIEMDSVWSEMESNGIRVIKEDDEDYSANETEPEIFIPADVNIGQRPANVYNLIERLMNEEIDLSPGFQRHGNLWSLENQSRLIESLMLKIPIPAFYFNAAEEDKWVVIDGLQRLTAFQNYLVGVKDIKGEYRKEKFVGLQYLSEFDGFTFDELPRQYVRRIKEAPIVAYTVEKGTPDAVVYNIFQRINTGGLELNPQEIRQALYMGVATDLIQELAKCEEFILATENAIPTERMADREYVTRFIAFTEIDYNKEYKGNIDNYLIKALKVVNSYDEMQCEVIANNFKRIMKYCHKIFGRYAFRKVAENGRRGPINKALFELWGVCFSELSDADLDILVKNKELFFEGYKKLMLQNDFITALKAGDQYSTVKRIEIARNLIKEYL